MNASLGSSDIASSCTFLSDLAVVSLKDFRFAVAFGLVGAEP